jgi:NADPH:quinone reductase-like Zn-dependent oxidoreductase
VLVQMQASSVNDYDGHLLTGKPLVNRVGGPFKPKHRALGCDVAGRIAAAGRAVTRFRPGDQVFGDLSGCGFGAFAEYVRAPQGALVLKPAALSFQQVAAVPQADGLAVLGLRRRPIQPGHQVLINGTGTFAVQIAKTLGAEVTGVDRAAKLDTVRAVGADHVIDFTTDDFTRNRGAYDLIIDVAASRPMYAYRRALKPGGACAIIGGSIPRVTLALAAGPGLSLLGSKKVGVPLLRPNNPQDVGVLTRLFQAGSITPVIDSVFPLTEIAAAFRASAPSTTPARSSSPPDLATRPARRTADRPAIAWGKQASAGLQAPALLGCLILMTTFIAFCHAIGTCGAEPHRETTWFLWTLMPAIVWRHAVLSRGSRTITGVSVDRRPAKESSCGLTAAQRCHSRSRSEPAAARARALAGQPDDSLWVRLQVEPPRWVALVPAVHRQRHEVGTVLEVADDDAALVPGLPPDDRQAQRPSRACSRWSTGNGHRTFDRAAAIHSRIGLWRGSPSFHAT